MPVVTSDILRLTFAGVKTDFDSAYNEGRVTAEWGIIATEIPTTLPIQDYAWLGGEPSMNEYTDRSQDQGVRSNEYQLRDRIYDATMSIERKALEDDQYALLKTRTQGLASRAVRHWNKLAYQGLVLGFASKCYDGQYFFDSDHQEGDSPVQSNLTNAPLSDAALEAARTSMMEVKDDKGEPMDIKPNVLVVGPKLERRASDLLGSGIVVVHVGDGAVGTGASAATNYANFHQGKYQLVVNHDITGAAAYNWFLADTTRTVKPIVIQSRADVPISIESDMLEQSAHMREKYKVRVRGRYVQGYGLWQTAYGSNATQ